MIASDALLIDIEDLITRNRVRRLHPEIFGDREAETQRCAHLLLIEPGFVLIVEFFVEEIEARRQVAIKEARFRERQVDLHALERTGECQAQELSVAEQVALGDRHVADHAFTRRVTRAEREFARRLFFHHHVEHDAVGSRARMPLDIDIFEDAEPLQALLGAIDHQRIVGIAFREPEFAPDHIILGARIADDVDAIDVNLRTFSTTYVMPIVRFVVSGMERGRTRANA